jgi:hypothetical protein
VDNNLVPQFKENANPKTGEVQGQELQGQRYERPANAIVVWELRDGRKVVVTGRHRLALAKRLGEKTIPTTIVREADGFTRADALTLDAQFNIRDGNGSLDDYANYFKNTAISEADARAAGLLDRAQGKAGWLLGRAASDDLTALYRAGKIEAREALAIARTAPSDAGAQQVGIKFALAGRPAAFIENVMRATQAEVGARETTIDMFGADDSAMQQMAERAERAGQFQRELRDQIQAVQGAAKRPEAARKLGVDVNDPEGVAKKVAELKAELTRWENWPTEPDLMAKVKGEPAVFDDTNNYPAVGEKIHTPKLSDDESDREAITRLKAGGMTHDQAVEHLKTQRKIGYDQLAALPDGSQVEDQGLILEKSGNRWHIVQDDGDIGQPQALGPNTGSKVIRVGHKGPVAEISDRAKQAKVNRAKMAAAEQIAAAVFDDTAMPVEEVPPPAPKAYPDLGPGSPADQYGAIYGPKLTPKQLAAYDEQVGNEFPMESPAGTTTKVRIDSNKIWLTVSQPERAGSSYENLSVAYLHISADGTTIIDGSHHGRPLDALARDQLRKFLLQASGPKDVTPAPKGEIDLRSGQAAMFGYDDSGFALEQAPGEHVSAPTEAELAEQARLRAANEEQQGKMFGGGSQEAGKPKFAAELYQGRGAPLADIYGPEAVAEGRAVPILGPGEYYAFDAKKAAKYGKVSQAKVSLQNPLVIDSSKAWFDLLDAANAQHLNSGGPLFYREPKGIAPATLRLKAYVQAQGHDGIIIRGTDDDRNKRLRESFGHDQVVVYDKPAAPRASSGAAGRMGSPPAPRGEHVSAPTEAELAEQARLRAANEKQQGKMFGEEPPDKPRVEAMGGSAPRSRARVAAAEDATPETPQQQRASSLALVQDLQRAQAMVAPQTSGPLSRRAANIIREVTGQQALVMAQASERLEKFRGQFDRTPVVKGWAWPTEGGKESGVRSQESEPKPLPVGQVKLPANYAFIDAYEGGGAAAVAPELRPVAEELARQNQVLMLDRLHALGDGVLKEGIEFYFPHVWKDPTKAAAFLSKWIARNPLEGSKSFLKERTHALFIDGLKAGLEPISDNPVDMWLLKLHEVNRFIAGRTIAKMFAERGLTKFVSVFARPPEGWHALDDVAFTKWGPPTVTIKEAYDEGMRQSVLDVLAKLGVPHERLATLRGKTWGLAYNMRNPANNLPGNIKSRFAGPDWVIWHELGHVLDFRYPELRTVMFGGDPSEVRSVRARVAFKHKLAPEHNDIMQRDAELRALADARAGIGKEIPESFQKYLRKTSEKMAVVLQAYLHAPALMAKIAPTIKAAFEKFLHDHPELRIIDDIKPTLELGVGTAEKALPGMVKLGQHFAPAEVAGVVNNFLKPGLQKWAVYRTLREGSNSLNSAQLIGFFHAGFTSLDAVVSRVSLGITAAMNGDVRDGARVFASVPLSLVTNVRRGIELRRAAVMTPEELAQEPAEMQAVVRALAAGGGRVGMDRVWQTQFRRRMVRAIHQARAQLAAGEWLGGLASYGGAALKAPFALVEQIMHPILEWLVPRQKLGVFYDMAARALKEIPANAPDGAEREVMRRIWDNVEDRLGQITYDNLFINRSIKDVALLAFRAFGWQLTKYRAFGGAAIDAAKYVRDSAAYGKAKVTGKPGVPPPDWTERMSYPMALAIVVGIIGGLIHYLYTGRRPVGMDYFQPQTGELDRNGNPVRLNLPSYIKDIVAYSKHPLTSFGHSLNPMLSAGWDLLNNRDFYNTQIHNPEDPWGEQAKEIAQWGAGELVPFSVSGAMQLHDDGSPLWKQVAPWFGFTPVPQRLTMTPAQELASELMAAAMPQQAMTRADFAKKKTLKDIVAMIKNGASADAMPELAGAIQRGDLNAASLHVMLEKLRMTPLQFQVHMMTAEAALRVWQVANPDERAMLWPLLHSKLTNSKTMTPQQKGAARIMLNNGRPESPEPVTAP